MILIHWDSAGVTVGLSDNIGIKEDVVVRSGADGEFTVDLPSGFYDVFASSPAFTPTSRKVRVRAGQVPRIVLRLQLEPLYTAEMGSVVMPALDAFEHGVPNYVPEGKPKRQRGISTVPTCEAACSENIACRAYAFRIAKPACYFYNEVLMGGTATTRSSGMYSSGISVLPHKGFVSAIKKSSFPAR